MTSITSWFRDRALTSRHLPLYLAGAAMALTLPSLWTGWQQDDLLQRYYLLGNPDVHGNTVSALNMFAFLDGDTSTISALKDVGVVPWWTYAHLRLAFWRPLAGVTHWLDYFFWPDNPVLMHMQSIIWFALLVAVVTLLYRRFLGATWVAGLAALLYALDDAHGLPAGWLANRNAIIAALFGGLTVLAHDFWRREGRSAAAVLGPLLFGLGLLAGEAALATVAYLVAFAFFIDPGNPRQRFMALVPYGTIAIAWLAMYRVFGYGTIGSGFYIDPVTDPLAFMQAFLKRGSVPLTDQWFLPPSSLFIFLPDYLHPAFFAWSLGVVLVLAGVLWPIIRNDAIARFWCMGMLLSVPVVTATTPHSRLLLFIGFGGMGLLAMFLQSLHAKLRESPVRQPHRFFRRAIAGLLISTHLVLAPILLPLNAISHASMESYVQTPACAVDLGPGIQDQDLILVNPPIVFLTNFFISSRVFEGLSVPRHQRVLTPGNVEVRISRPDAHTLVVEPAGGYLAGPFDNVFRASTLGYRSGDREVLTGMQVEILSVGSDGRPDAAAFRFDVPLEHRSLRWLRWEHSRWIDFVPPSIGESVTLHAAGLPF